MLTKVKKQTKIQQLPATWWKAAGILKGKKRTDPTLYQVRVRAAWEKRGKKNGRKA